MGSLALQYNCSPGDDAINFHSDRCLPCTATGSGERLQLARNKKSQDQSTPDRHREPTAANLQTLLVRIGLTQI